MSIIFLTDSVKKISSFNTTTENDVEEVVKNWFRNSGDRDGGRDRRRKTHPQIK